MIVDALIRASIAGSVVVTAIWILTRVCRSLTPAMRAWLWWLAAAKFLVALLWWAPVELAVLPASSRLSAPVSFTSMHTAIAREPLPAAKVVNQAPLNGMTAHGAVVSTAPATTAAAARWPLVALSAWLCVVAVRLGLSIRRLQGARRLIRDSRAAPAPVDALRDELAARLSIARAPAVRYAHRLRTPLVVGWRSPVILLPEETFDTIAPREQAMSICHELAHIKRRDLGLGAVASLVEACFFFHPLARVAVREYALARESACDAMVLASLDASPVEYGRLLMSFGVIPPNAGLAGASRSVSFLKRRLLMLNTVPTRSRVSRALGISALLLATVALAPMQLTARQRPLPSGAVVVPATAVAGAPRPGDANSEFLLVHDALNVTWGRAASVSYVTFHAGAPKPAGTPTVLERRLSSLQSQGKPGEPLLWFVREGREYLVRDAATLREVDAIWQPRDLTPPKWYQPYAQAVSRTRKARDLPKADEARSRREADAVVREFETEINKLTADLRQARTMDALAEKALLLDTRVSALTSAMQQAARPGEADLQRILTRAIASGLAVPILTADDARPALSGRVITSRGLPDPDVRVLVFTTDRQKWIADGMSAGTTAVDANGQFHRRLLAGGDYFVLAVPKTEARAWVMPEKYPTLPDVALRLHIENNQAITNLELRTVGR